MANSNRMLITELAETQNNRSVTVNEMLAILEAAGGSFAVVAVGTTSPPGSPAEGDAHILGATPTGAWAGKGNNAAIYYNAAWLFVPPLKGYKAYDQTANGKYLYDGSAWVVDAGGSFATASTTAVLTGTDTSKGVTPDSLAALWEKGSNVASAGTVSLGEGGFFHITGTTTITDIDWVTAKDGRPATVIFDGALTLTHNATTLKLPGGANITTAAGDRAIFIQDSGDNVICIAYVRADGTPLVAAGTPFEIEVALSDETTAITTGAAKITWYAPMNATITEVFCGLSSQSTSGSVTIDLNKNGTTMFSTNPSIDANEDTNLTGTAGVLSTTTWNKGDKLTFDIDAAGTGAKGLKAVVRGTRS